MISDNKMLYHLDRVVGDHRPITADIFLTNYCNNRCKYCTYFRWDHENAYSMTFTDFVKYAMRLRSLGVKGFILSGGGEPTICKDFDKITVWLEKAGIPYGINTNFNELKFFKPTYLKVSLDAYCDTVYEEKRGVRAYEKVRNNIITYAEWKKVHSPNTTIGIQMVVTDLTEIIPFYKANRDLPVDYISFRPVESTDGIYYRDTHPAYFDSLNLRIESLDDPRVVRNFKFDMTDERFNSCVAHWSQIAIDERGNVIYCCHKPYQKIGHIMDDDILEKHREAATDMKMCDVPCRLTAPNLFMQEIENIQGDAPFI